MEGRVRKGRSRRITLGRYPALAMKEARELAMNNLNEMQKGVDPVLKEREETGVNEFMLFVMRIVDDLKFNVIFFRRHTRSLFVPDKFVPQIVM